MDSNGAEGGAGLHLSVRTGRKLALQPLTVHTQEGPGGECYVQWAVPACKLKSSDKQAVSPPFELSLGSRHVLFRVILYPKVITDGKGGSCFKKARGKGYMQLKCEAELDEMPGDVVFYAWLGEDDMKLPVRGPMQHSFAQSAVCGLQKEREEWDFASAVSKKSMTFIVCLRSCPLMASA